MYRLFVENDHSERIELTGNQNFDVKIVDGTNPPPAAINTNNIVGVDGSKLNSTRVEQRNIVITLNIKPPIEQNRIYLYRFFKVKRRVRLYYENRHRKCHIDGYVETFENNPWTQLQQPQISIICPQPFWIADDDTVTDFMRVIPLFEFPFSIPEEGIPFSELETVTAAEVDAGEIETGGIITMTALGDTVTNPKFINITTGQFFGVTISMQRDDIITINTNKGSKSVKLLRDGTETNLLSDRMAGSEWVQFEAGTNLIGYEATSGTQYLRVSVTLTQLFEGV